MIRVGQFVVTLLHDHFFSLWDLVFNESCYFPNNTSKGQWALDQRTLRRGYEDKRNHLAQCAKQ